MLSRLFFGFMYILYVDESGDGGSAPGSSKHLVLAGVAMHEGQWRKLVKSMDNIQLTHFPQAGGLVEFHACALRSGKKVFRGLPKAKRSQLMGDVYGVISGTARGLTLFAAIIDKPAFRAKYQNRVDPYEGAFEGLSTMFDFFLGRVQNRTGNVVRGIVVFDESRPALSKQIRSQLTKFQAGGTKWTAMKYLIETAFFFDSAASRIMQLADFVAYAVYRWYEANDNTLLKLILQKFDRQGSKMHGLKCYPLASTKHCTL